MKLAHIAEKFLGGSLRVDLMCAIAAGLCASILSSFINLVNQHRVDILAYVRFTLLALAAYLMVALLLHRFWTKSLRRMLPSWIIISVFGSLVFVTVRLLPAVIIGWHDPYNSEIPLMQYIAQEVSAARSVVVGLSLITLPIAAMIYYADFLIRAVKHWFEAIRSSVD